MSATAPAGIYPILYAFFGRDGSLDRTAMRRQAEACIKAGAHGIAVLGLITEVTALTDAERLQVIEWAAEDIDGRVPLAATIAGETAEAQTALAKQAEAAGAGWLILQPPKHTQPDGPQLMRFFGAVMDSVSIPVGIQNFPEVLGVGLTPPEVGDLHRQHANFTVMKGEGPVYQIRQYLEASGGGIHIFNGRGGIELPDNLRAGCAGIIPAPDCADVQIQMFESFVRGDTERMDGLYALTLPYVTFVMQSIGFALTYGKRLTARRLELDEDVAVRLKEVDADAFGLDRLAAHTEFLGPFGTWFEQAETRLY
ncbi:MAG: dihydrodipicolinate synthase family protein [Pseudomonadota bacterium]